MARTCGKCKSTMHKTGTMHSGNAEYETWQCDSCDNREMICLGITTGQATQ